MLPLPNASRLSEIMERIDPAWAAERSRFKPFSRLFNAFENDLREKGVGLERRQDRFSLVKMPMETGWIPWKAEHPILRTPCGGGAADFSLFTHGGSMFVVLDKCGAEA